MKKVLSHDPNLCTGCMYCMVACSTYNEGSASLSKARLQIIRHEGHALTRIDQEDELLFALVGCPQCEDPICSTVCPVAAIRKDDTTGAMVIDRDKCVGCKMCLMTCYFGAISFNEKVGTAFKCELCGGDPQCVRFCQPGALTYIPAGQVSLRTRMQTARKIMRGLVDTKEP